MSRFNCQKFMDKVREMAGQERRNVTPLTDLRICMRKNGEDFVKEAYLLILGREPDALGFEDYVPKANSIYGKGSILCSLLLAPEKIYDGFFARNLVNGLRGGKAALKKIRKIKK